MVKKKRQTDAFEDGSSTDSSEEKTMHSPTAAVHCQHIKKSVDTSRLRKAVKSTGVVVDCGQCKSSLAKALSEVNSNEDNAGFEYDNTLWMCLKCGTQLCGRSKNQHALQHFKIPHSDSHALAMNTRSFVIWCYECDNEVKLDSRKFLHECVDIIKRSAQKPITANSQKPATVDNIEDKILATWESIRPLVNKDDEVNSSKVVLPLPPVPPPPPIPGIAKRIEPMLNINAGKFGGLNSTPTPNVLSIADIAVKKNAAVNVPALPRVRGLTNLGNTCFFNAVVQCLAQTPYLLDVLKESAEPGEEFILPGGTFKFKDDEDVELPMIKGTLSSWGTLTAALANVLEELQLGGGVFTPSKLFDKFCLKCPQFRGGEQHDSHELLRQLLESVRSEDLKRYQRVILQSLGYKDQDSVSDEMRQKCKIYGNQAADRILRPDQVFRGFLVSTLTCQSCYNVSSRHEYFLDLSLPVSVEKPQVPQRRRTSPENAASSSCSFFLDPMTSATANDNAAAAANTAPTLNKAQLRKEKKTERKEQKAAAKAETAKLANRRKARDNKTSTVAGCENIGDAATAISNTDDAFALSSSSSYEQSDADVEDNLIDDNATENRARVVNLPTAALTDTNGNSATLPSPGNLEKRDDSPENMDKDSLDEDENDSGIVSSPAYTDSNQHTISSAVTNGIASVSTIKNSVVSIGLSQKSATLVRSLSASGNDGSTIGGNPAMARQPPTEQLPAKPQDVDDDSEILAERLNDNLQLQSTRQQQQQQLQQKRARARRARTQSYSDWSTTIAPRFQCEDGECSVQSCLNNFTGVELMTGNNKVGCENCTKNLQANNEQNADNSKPKTVYTNATKQFLISSPPAVLILHLKRFQLGPRCIFRKLTRSVGYPNVLDIAPFCGSKVKNLPNIDRKQKKLLYALYGVVEHAGSMYGGHYTAYVKVRARLSKDDKRWKFIPQGSKAELDQDDEQRKKLDELLAKEKARELRLKATNDSDDFSTSDSASNTASADDSGAEGEFEGAAGGSKANEASNVEIPTGKWYYVSDSLVQEVTEDSALQAQAYLLFYERIY